jgi:hypothetical protein
MNARAAVASTPRPSPASPYAALGVRFPDGKRRDESPVFARNELFLPAAPEAVWGWLLRAERWPEYYGNAKDIVVEGGPDLALGTKFRWTTFGVRAHTVIEELVPFERLSWSGRGFGGTAYHGWVIAAAPGGCHVITEETQQGALVSLARAFLRRGLLTWHQRWLDGLGAVAAKGHPRLVPAPALP